MWSETKMNRLSIIFERIREVPQQKRGIILEEGNQNENRKPVPWDRDPATFNCLIIN